MIHKFGPLSLGALIRKEVIHHIEGMAFMMDIKCKTFEQKRLLSSDVFFKIEGERERLQEFLGRVDEFIEANQSKEEE